MSQPGQSGVLTASQQGLGEVPMMYWLGPSNVLAGSWWGLGGVQTKSLQCPDKVLAGPRQCPDGVSVIHDEVLARSWQCSGCVLAGSLQSFGGVKMKMSNLKNSLRFWKRETILRKLKKLFR